MALAGQPRAAVRPVRVTVCLCPHSTIRNVDSTVSIVPVGDAKTYVNGRHVLEPTVLHHVSWPMPNVSSRVLWAGFSVQFCPRLELPFPDPSSAVFLWPSHKLCHCELGPVGPSTASLCIRRRAGEQSGQAAWPHQPLCDPRGRLGDRSLLPEACERVLFSGTTLGGQARGSVSQAPARTPCPPGAGGSRERVVLLTAQALRMGSAPHAHGRCPQACALCVPRS